MLILSCAIPLIDGISFMGKKWDYDVPQVEVWKECLRVLKPGGHALVACGTRTQHRMAVNLEDGGFEIRDLIFYHYGSGFPKSHNIEKSLKKMGEVSKAEEYKGFGTALKPSTEIWTLCRKPLEEKTIASNVLKYGTGGINIEKSRVPTQDDEARKQKILSGEVVCNAFCDKHKSYPSSLFDILSFSRLQLYDFYQHIFSELGSYNNSYTNLLHNLEELDYKNYKQLLGVPYDCGLLAGRANEYVHAYQEVLNSQDDCPTLSRLYDVFVRCQKVSDQDVFPLSNDVQVDILHFLSSKENNQLNDNNPLLVFVLALVAYSLLVNNNLHNHYTTCKNKSKGRFPANLIHSGEDEVVEGFPETKSTPHSHNHKKDTAIYGNGKGLGIREGGSLFNDSGSASRYFKECKFTNKELVDLNNSFMYNESILNNNKKICGHILENQKADIILVGVIKEAEKLTQNVEQFLCGKKSMENIQKDIVSIIKIVTKQMIELRTLLVLPLQSITIFTEESEKTIKLLKELNTENVRNVKNIKLLITFKNEVQELIKDTVKNVVEQNLKNGEKRIGKNTTPTTENIASRIKYCAKASKSERNKGCEEIFVLKEKIPEDDLNEIKHLLSI